MPELPPDLPFAIDAPEQLKSRKDKAKTAAERDAADLRAVLALPEGRRLLARVIAHAAPLASSFAADPLTMAFREGHRNAGLALVAMVSQTAPEHLPALLFPPTSE